MVAAGLVAVARVRGVWAGDAGAGGSAQQVGSTVGTWVQ